MKDALLHVSRAVTGVLSAALVGKAGIPVLAVLGCLTVLVIAVVCWIVNSQDRSMNLSRILFARRGDARCLDPDIPGRAPEIESRAPGRRARKGPRRVPPQSA
jgi:hypothetical protein